MKRKLLLAAKGAGLTVLGALVAQTTNYGIDATPLVILPPIAKGVISLALPIVGAWLKTSPLKKEN